MSQLPAGPDRAARRRRAARAPLDDGDDLRLLQSGAARFNEFRQSLPGVSPTTLSERLEQLEAAGIVERRLVAGRPPHTEYALTDRGRRVAAAVAGLLAH